jgi:hypothetical protein
MPPPSGDVVIPISSSNTAEGRYPELDHVHLQQLVSPGTITVTGINDSPPRRMVTAYTGTWVRS